MERDWSRKPLPRYPTEYHLSLYAGLLRRLRGGSLFTVKFMKKVLKYIPVMQLLERAAQCLRYAERRAMLRFYMQERFQPMRKKVGEMVYCFAAAFPEWLERQAGIMRAIAGAQNMHERLRRLDKAVTTVQLDGAYGRFNESNYFYLADIPRLENEIKHGHSLEQCQRWHSQLLRVIYGMSDLVAAPWILKYEQIF